ncbi:interferon regulatory factor 4-like [Ornithodoros turicata]|uniref:interferon regulatory factor 4-like n=1 Tax=Ornithodoros turicata TaxID=34597 RepID=UPI003139A197
MPSRGTGRICRFLVRHLDDETFGDRLCWLDKECGVFRILWPHGNACMFQRKMDYAVFAAWDCLKGRQRDKCDESEKIFCDAKHRFRTALKKMDVKKLVSWKHKHPPKYYHFRQIPTQDLKLLEQHGSFAERPLPAKVRKNSAGDCNSSEPILIENLENTAQVTRRNEQCGELSPSNNFDYSQDFATGMWTELFEEHDWLPTLISPHGSDIS